MNVKTHVRVQHQLFLLSGLLLTLTLMLGLAAILMVQHESRAIQSIYADSVVPLKQLKTWWTSTRWTSWMPLTKRATAL